MKKNDKRKLTIRGKVNEYLERAEEIGQLISKGQDKQDSAGGTASKKKETTKMMTKMLKTQN